MSFVMIIKNYVKPYYGEKAELCYMDTDSFIVYIKTDDIYKDIAEDVETQFNTSNYELDRPMPKEKYKKVIGLMKDELGGKIMKEYSALRAKSYSDVSGNNDKDKSQRCKKMSHKKKLKKEQ